MLVRMLVELSGPGLLLAPGDEREFPTDEALRLVKAEFAVPVLGDETERAVAEPVLERRGRKKRQPQEST